LEGALFTDGPKELKTRDHAQEKSWGHACTDYFGGVQVLAKN
jgi:hypothetical protein